MTNSMKEMYANPLKKHLPSVVNDFAIN